MESPERSCIFFHKPALGLDDAASALRAKGMTASRKGDVLSVVWKDSPTLHVHFVQGDGVRKDAVHVGRGKSLEALLRECDSAFVITFEDLDQVLDEANVLIEVQLDLQALTGGVIMRSWNDELSGPEDAT